MKFIDKFYRFANLVIAPAYENALAGHELEKTVARISKHAKTAVDELYQDETCAANREAERVFKEIRTRVRASMSLQSI